MCSERFRRVPWLAALLIGVMIAVAFGFDLSVRVALAQSTPPPRDTPTSGPTPGSTPTLELTPPGRSTPTPANSPTPDTTPLRSTPTGTTEPPPPRTTPTSSAPGDQPIGQPEATSIPTPVLLPVSGSASTGGFSAEMLIGIGLGIALLSLGTRWSGRHKKVFQQRP